jgi:hypothetical protein
MHPQHAHVHIHGRDYMQEAFAVVSPKAGMEFVWQTDGRPMSGDVGRGMSHASVAFAQRALEVCLHICAHWRYADIYVHTGGMLTYMCTLEVCLHICAH